MIGSARGVSDTSPGATQSIQRLSANASGYRKEYAHEADNELDIILGRRACQRPPTHQPD